MATSMCEVGDHSSRTSYKNQDTDTVYSYLVVFNWHMHIFVLNSTMTSRSNMLLSYSYWNLSMTTADKWSSPLPNNLCCQKDLILS